VPRDRRDARRHRRDRGDRACAREAGVPTARGVHRRALGHDDVSGTSERTRSLTRAALTLLVAAAVYEATARSGFFPPPLLPPLPAVARPLVATPLDGTMPLHALHTLYRVAAGLALAVAIGLPLGILMGRIAAVEGFVLPLASALMPIPSLAWVPVFILWF